MLCSNGNGYFNPNHDDISYIPLHLPLINTDFLAKNNDMNRLADP